MSRLPIIEFEDCILTILYNSEDIESKCLDLSKSTLGLQDEENVEEIESVKKLLAGFFTCYHQVDALYDKLSEVNKFNMQGVDDGWKHTLDLAISKLKSRYQFTKPIKGYRDEYDVLPLMRSPKDRGIKSAWKVVRISLEAIANSRDKAVEASMPTTAAPASTEPVADQGAKGKRNKGGRPKKDELTTEELLKRLQADEPDCVYWTLAQLTAKINRSHSVIKVAPSYIAWKAHREHIKVTRTMDAAMKQGVRLDRRQK
jgi:hypothetical protein